MNSRIVLAMFCLLVVALPSFNSTGGNAAFAQNPALKSESTAERMRIIHGLTVEKNSDSLAVEIRADGPCTFKQYTLENPTRLVIDIPDAVNKARPSTQTVNHLMVRAVRIGQFKLGDPTITRVVLDLDGQMETTKAFQVKSRERSIHISLAPTKMARDAANSGASHPESGAPTALSATQALPPPVRRPESGVSAEDSAARDKEAAARAEDKDRLEADPVNPTTPSQTLTPETLGTIGKLDKAQPFTNFTRSVFESSPTASTETTANADLETNKSSSNPPSTTPDAKAAEATSESTEGNATVDGQTLSKDSAKTSSFSESTAPRDDVSTASPAGTNIAAEARVDNRPITADSATGDLKPMVLTAAATSPLPLKQALPFQSAPITSEVASSLEPLKTSGIAPKEVLSTGAHAQIAGRAAESKTPMTLSALHAVPTGPANITSLLKPTLAGAKALPQASADQGRSGAPTATSEMPRYSGEPISLDFKDGDLVDFFRLLSQITGLNMVLDPTIKGTISIKMTNVPYDQIFDVVLENNGLDKKIEGNVVRIARKETLRKEEEERRRLQDARTLAADTATETIKLNYASAETLSKMMVKHLSPKGEIVVDQRTNALIVKDIMEPLVSLKKLVHSLDTAEPQVEIEARIVSASRDFARDIGVQLGMTEGNLERSTIGGPNTFGTIGGVRPSASPGDTTFGSANERSGRGQPRGQTVSGGVSTGIGNSTVGNYLVNLPAQPPNRLSGIGWSLGNIFDKFLLDASITAGESRGQAKLVSQPKVTVQNNVKAQITQGIRFPVQVIQNNTVSVQFFDAALKLTVVPQITDAGTILLDLQVENNVADFAKQVNGIPSIRTSESKTKVLVGDGGTTVIAGILVDSENRVEQRAPGIASIPILGNLFKRRFNDRTTQEVLFFITPRIRKEGF